MIKSWKKQRAVFLIYIYKITNKYRKKHMAKN